LRAAWVKTSTTRWYTPEHPATQEAEVGGSQSKASLGKKTGVVLYHFVEHLPYKNKFNPQ
jgi:hypothetical protein